MALGDYTPVLSKVKMPGGNVYYLKDAWAREQLENITSYSKYLGVTTTVLSDGSDTNPITVGDESVQAETGNIVIYGDKEFIYNGSTWQEFGDLSALKDELGNMAYVDDASTSYTPSGTVNGTFVGNETTISLGGTVTGSMTAEFEGEEGNISATGTVAEKTVIISGTSGTPTYTPEGNVTGSVDIDEITVEYNYTPQGTLSATFTGSQGNISASGVPLGIVQMAEIVVDLANGNYTPTGSVSVTLNKTDDSVNSLTSVGTSASFNLASNKTIAVIDSMDGEQLNLIWNSELFNFTPNALPSYSAVSVLTDVSVSSATFTGDRVLISATFSGSDTTFSGTFTPSGTVSGTFSGSTATLTSSVTPTGSISATFTGSSTRLVGTVESQTINVSGTFTPSGTVSGELNGASTTVSGSYTPSGSISTTFSGSAATITVSAPKHVEP